ncbi:adenosylcobinamide-GDP ribazoletransferase [Nocardioides sp. GCM10027113]|uniref:adenosylcobinamide-GDP ribazoletransferase n=1 Tax=unclassified Nocardioides TaxID=2615069 RepID=UPI003622FE53
MNAVAAGARLAVGTLTVMPVRPPARVDRRVGGIAMALAPLAVVPVAAGAGLVVWLGDLVQAPPLLVAVAVVAVLALGSGGLHLDGLADSADGLAVPGDRDRRLQVMRAGDVGPVGAVTLLLVVLAQVAALADVVSRGETVAAAGSVVVAVVASRVAVTAACTHGIPAARDDGLGSAVAGTVPAPVTVVALSVVAVCAFAVDGGHGLAGVAVAGVATTLLLLRARSRLGGVTGDVLGACVELALVGYLVALVVLPG